MSTATASRTLTVRRKEADTRTVKLIRKAPTGAPPVARVESFYRQIQAERDKLNARISDMEVQSKYRDTFVALVAEPFRELIESLDTAALARGWLTAAEIDTALRGAMGKVLNWLDVGAFDAEIAWHDTVPHKVAQLRASQRCANREQVDMIDDLVSYLETGTYPASWGFVG